MKIEYLHGQRLTPLLHELSPLDLAINGYVEKAKVYFQIEKNFDKSVTREEREKKLNAAFQHLEHERMLAETIVCVQADLAAYQAFGKAQKGAAGRAVLASENHHPTKLLAKLMRAANKPKPSEQHTPHHIVIGKGRTKAAALARLHIHRYAIRINDPDNGVWLVKNKADTPHWSMPQSKNHLSIHINNYETWVLQSITIYRAENQIRQKLNILGRMLQHGTQPKQVTMPPDEAWNG